MPDATPVSKRLTGIEGLRGCAALAILGWHQIGLSVSQPILGHAFKSVGLFFMISGFVMAHAYEARLNAGLSPWTYSALRIRRLYPLYLAGTLLGFLLALVGLGLPHVGPAEAIQALPAALCLWPGGLPSDNHLFALDAPGWSLFLEAVVSIAYAFLLPVLTNRVLMALAGVGFVFMELQLARLGTLDGGWNRATFAVGVARVVYGFPAGVLLQRLWRRGALPTAPRSVGWVCLVFLVVAATPPAGVWNPPLEILISGLIWPALLVIAANARATPRSARVAEWLGERSFALYAVHFPIIAALRHVAGPPGTLMALCAGVASVALALLAADAATRWIDRPLRRGLARSAPRAALA